MKRIIYLTGVAAVVALTGCAHDRQRQGGTDNHYEQDSDKKSPDYEGLYKGAPGGPGNLPVIVH
jgi:hypothetical protein